MTVGAENLPALLNSLRKFCENALGVVPANASISDADTIFETRLSFLGNLLGT